MMPAPNFQVPQAFPQVPTPVPAPPPANFNPAALGGNGFSNAGAVGNFTAPTQIAQPEQGTYPVGLPAGLNVGPGQDTANFSAPPTAPAGNAPVAGQPPALPGGKGNEPSDAEIQAMLQQILGGAAGGQGGPGGVPGMPEAPGAAMGAPSATASKGGAHMVQQGGMVLEVGGDTSGGGGLVGLLNPQILLNPKTLVALALIAGGAFGLKQLLSRSEAAAGDTAHAIAQDFKNYFIDGHENLVTEIREAAGDAEKLEALGKKVLAKVEDVINLHKKEGQDVITGQPEREAAASGFKKAYETLFERKGAKRAANNAKAKAQGFLDKVVQDPQPAAAAAAP
jgi:hypothetical protein